MAEAASSEMLLAAPVGVLEESLIGESVWGAIQALKERGRSKKQVARELGLDIKTVRKWWRRAWRLQRWAQRGRWLDVSVL